MKRITSILIIVTLLGMLTMGCGQKTSVDQTDPSQSKQEQEQEHTQSQDDTDGTETDNENNWLSQQKKKWHVGENVSFDWYLNFSWWGHNTKEWTEYPILNEVTQITGVTPNVIIPAGDGNEKLNLMISTNDLPDVITMDQNDANVIKMIKQGLLYSYDELIEKYVPEFRNEIPEEVYRYVKSDVDGKLYGLPNFFVPDNMANNPYSYNVRKDIYQELGSPDISTPDNLKAALRAFKEKYPTMNGRSSIPLTLRENYKQKFIVENSFGIREFYENDGEIQHRYKDPRYVNFVKYINELYREGLLDQEGYVKKSDQISEDLTTRVFMVADNCWSLWTPGEALDKIKPDSHYIVVDPPMAAPGESFEWGQYKPGWTTTLITKQAENPEAIIKFIRYMWSPEGNLLMLYGHEGEDYVIEGNKIIRTEKVNKKLAENFDGYCEETGLWFFYWLQYSYWDNALTGAFVEPPDRARDREIANSYVTYDATPYKYKMNPDPTSREGIIATQVTEIENKEYPKIIMAKSEGEAVQAYQNMIDKMNKVGLERLEQWWTKQYQTNLRKFKGQ